MPFFELLRKFASSAGANYSTFVGEWALSKAGSSISLDEVARWWYKAAAATPHGSGLAVWNYDGPGNWGALAPNGEPNRSWWKGVNKWP